ncbi:hypothetical protein BASA81_006891 [Batrachochytrium salamandrivorans]|nr:hypothetical protein BASA81_006891 [Batrachochytrium salamandrivorans]
MEYLQITGLRADGRLPAEHRRVRIELGGSAQADGSAVFELGMTKVWAGCRGPRESSTGAVGVAVEIASAPFSTMERKRPAADRKRLRELAATLEKALNRIVEVAKFPKSRVDLSVRVVQNDGGLPWAIFNACSLALMDAGVPMTDLCVACGVCFADQTVLVDPNYSEQGGAGGGELWMAFAPRESKMVSCAFAGRVSAATMRDLLETGQDACQEMFHVISAFAVTNNAKNGLLSAPAQDDHEREYMQED